MAGKKRPVRSGRVVTFGTKEPVFFPVAELMGLLIGHQAGIESSIKNGVVTNYQRGQMQTVEALLQWCDSLQK